MMQYLSTVRSQREGFDNIAALMTTAKSLWADRLEIDFSRCTFFDANMAAPLAAVLSLVTDELNSVEIVRVPNLIERILRKNGFLLDYGYSTLYDNNDTTLPFRRIRLTEAGIVAEYLEQHLKGKSIPTMTRGLGKVFRQSIFEVFQNAVAHSRSRLGVFVCGQFYPQTQRLDFTFADAGVGIRTNVRDLLKMGVSSVAAIRWALQKGNTTKTGMQPGGIGLKFLKDFIAQNQGKIQLVSRFGFYEFKDNQESFQKLSNDFPGTVVNLEINTADTNTYILGSEVLSENIFC